MFELKIKAHVLAASLYGPGKIKNDFANLYLRLLRHERELLEDRETDEKELRKFFAIVRRLDSKLLDALAKKHLVRWQKDQWAKFEEEEHQLLMFLMYLIMEAKRKKQIGEVKPKGI